MQTFLPYPDFRKSAQVLDGQRLGKQRLEAAQILAVLRDDAEGWAAHPAVEMWRGYEDALCAYMDAMVDQWVLLGCNNSYPPYWKRNKPYEKPWWLGWDYFHRTHRCMLIEKNTALYRPRFPALETLPYVPRYIWPRGKAGIGYYRIGKNPVTYYRDEGVYEGSSKKWKPA